jgi:hypothetical protein
MTLALRPPDIGCTISRPTPRIAWRGSWGPRIEPWPDYPD